MFANPVFITPGRYTGSRNLLMNSNKTRSMHGSEKTYSNPKPTDLKPPIWPTMITVIKRTDCKVQNSRKLINITA